MMNAREVIARAIAESHSGTNGSAVTSYPELADAALSAYHAHLEAAGMAIVPVEVADLVHKSMGKDFTRIETLAVRARLLGEG